LLEYRATLIKDKNDTSDESGAKATNAPTVGQVALCQEVPNVRQVTSEQVVWWSMRGIYCYTGAI